MANRWGNNVSSDRFYFFGLQNNADGDCSFEIKRHLLLGRKAMKILDNILKIRVITLLKQFHIVKAMVFPVIMYWHESWTIKKTECWRIDGFELWCWRRLLRVPWAARRSNQSILKEINPEYWLEGLMLKLKLQSFGYLMRRKDPGKGYFPGPFGKDPFSGLLEKTLMLKKTKGRRRRGLQRMRWLDASPAQ